MRAQGASAAIGLVEAVIRGAPDAVRPLHDVSDVQAPAPAAAPVAVLVGTKVVAILIAGFGILTEPLPSVQVALFWAYCLVWVVSENLVKFAVHTRHIRIIRCYARSSRQHGRSAYIPHLKRSKRRKLGQPRANCRECGSPMW